MYEAGPVTPDLDGRERRAATAPAVTAHAGLTATAAGHSPGPDGEAVSVSAGAAIRAGVAAVRHLATDPGAIAAAAIGVGSGVTVSVLALVHAPGAQAIGVLVPGVLALIGGLLLTWTGWGEAGRTPFRWMLGAALVIWSAGQLWNGIALIAGSPGFPAPGDVVSIVAAPVAFAALLAVPWRGRTPQAGWRLGLDACLVGVTLALPLWHFGFAPAVQGDVVLAPDLVAAIILVAETTVVCVCVLAFLRDFDPDVLLVWAGVTCFVIGDLLNVNVNVRTPGGSVWGTALMLCLSWPLVVTGLLRYQPLWTRDAPQAWPLNLDARGVLVSTTASVALIVLTLAALIMDSSVDRISLGLLILVALVFWARELLNARFRAQLLQELHAEATADPLTGLANRRVLAGRMAALSQRDSWCLLTVDLDGFKDVNDLLGHGTGDRLLAAVANRLREASPADALVSRIGGDEFAILLPGDIEVGARVGAAIVTAVRQSAADVEGVARVEVSASVGVAAVHGDGARAGSITLPPARPLAPGAPYDGADSRPRSSPRSQVPHRADQDDAAVVPAPAGDGATTAQEPGMADEYQRGAPLSHLGGEPGSSDDPIGELAGAGADELAGLGPAFDRALGGTARDLGPVAGDDEDPVAAPLAPAAVPALVDTDGVPLDTPEVVDPLSALSASSAALRVAKAAGRNRVEIYDAGVAQIRRRRLRVEERLRSAVETGAITVLYQPIVDLRRGVVAGCEALARWHDDELGRVDPGEFITVAEQTGLVVAIGERVLQETLRHAVSAGLFERGLRVSCNVSPVQLRVAGFHRVVQEAIASHGVAREQLVIEVTEQVLVEEGQAAQTLHRLANLGLTIAIDDFGTGYSALGYLQRLPADILKIDRSLTSSLIAEPRSRAITRAVVDLGRTVGLSVVVEGVESSQVDDLVRKMGVGFGQGLYYGAAMPAPDLAAMADRLSSDHAR